MLCICVWGVTSLFYELLRYCVGWSYTGCLAVLQVMSRLGSYEFSMIGLFIHLQAGELVTFNIVRKELHCSGTFMTTWVNSYGLHDF